MTTSLQINRLKFAALKKAPNIHCMKLQIIKTTLILTLLLPFSAHSQMYKWVDEDGNVSYSDQPPFKGANTLAPPDLNTTPKVDIPKEKPKSILDSKPNETSYSFFKITAPENDATIRSNAGNFSASLGLKPALNTSQGHYISVFLDNKLVQDKLTSQSISFSNIDRGTHQIKAEIRNRAGKTISNSNTITVHMHRKSILNPKPL